MLKALLLAACLIPSALAQHPSLFRKLEFPAAQELARKEGKLLLLDAMTSWCGPCKMMDATTWVDPKVEAWVAANAIAVQLDMDLHTELKENLGINAFPTMVLFLADGKEFDRIVGSRNADQMLEWLGGALGGQKEIDRVRLALKELNESGEARTRDRMVLAERAADLGANQEVGEQILWLWSREPVDVDEARLLSNWRLGSGRNLTSEFLDRFGEWRGPIQEQRAARTGALKAAENARVRAEWITLNQILGDSDSTVTWAAGLATARETRPVLQSHGGQLFELLVDRGLWAAAGHCLNDPLKQQRFLGDNLGAYDVKPNRAEGAPGSIPMIPMGGMAPSQGDSAPAANDSSVEAASNPGLPMIPMGRNAPAKRDAIPAVPLQGGPPADTQPRESVPMIPMGGPKPAQDTSAGVPAVPMVSMGGPAAARPETPEEVAAEVRSRLTHELRRMSARRYGALLAADRMAEAEAVALALLKYADDDAARAALVTCALRAGCIDRRQSAHLLWLDSVARGAGM